MVCACLLALPLLSSTYAWLFITKERPHDIVATNLIVHPEVYFTTPDNVSTISADPYMDNGYYVVNLSDPMAPNYVSRLHVTINVTGTTRCYLRVYVADMWVANEDDGNGNIVKTVFLQENTNFQHPINMWLDNRLYDTYYYYNYNNPTYGRGVVANPTEANLPIPFITGLSEEIGIIDNSELYLEIRAEVVQYNRLEAFWNMTAIPLPI